VKGKFTKLVNLGLVIKAAVVLYLDKDFIDVLEDNRVAVEFYLLEIFCFKRQECKGQVLNSEL
jgi:hypothetical protein